MSKYIFIASDFEIPEVDLTNEQIITPIEAKLKGIKPPCFCSWDELDPNSEILYFESEDDMYNLCVRKEENILDDVRFYTDKEFIYQVSCSLDNKRAKQLLDYIKDIQLWQNRGKKSKKRFIISLKKIRMRMRMRSNLIMARQK